MGKTKKLPQVVLALTLLVGITMAAQAQRDAGDAPQLPPGKWSVSIGPYMNPGYESLPIRVVSVTSEVEAGLGVSQVAVENRSSQMLTAVKLVWYLSAAETPEIILRQGETRLLELPPGIQSNETRDILFPVVSFAKVYKPLLKGGVLSGRYRIQIAVSEARFDDGSSWTLASARSKVRKTQLVVYSSKPTPQAFCPNQACSAVSGSDPTGPPAGYQCGSATGQLCTNSGRTCTNSICGSGGGPQPPISPPPRPN